MTNQSGAYHYGVESPFDQIVLLKVTLILNKHECTLGNQTDISCKLLDIK